jgi:hypothetical protein
MGVRALSDGRTVLDVNRGPALDVDEEAAGFILGFELDYLLSNYGDDKRHRGAAYNYYLTSGVLQLAATQPGTIDAILKRTAYKEAMGLTEDGTDLERLLPQTLSAEERRQIIAKQTDEDSDNSISPR